MPLILHEDTDYAVQCQPEPSCDLTHLSVKPQTLNCSPPRPTFPNKEYCGLGLRQLLHGACRGFCTGFENANAHETDPRNSLVTCTGHGVQLGKEASDAKKIAAAEPLLIMTTAQWSVPQRHLNGHRYHLRCPNRPEHDLECLGTNEHFGDKSTVHQMRSHR